MEDPENSKSDIFDRKIIAGIKHKLGLWLLGKISKYFLPHTLVVSRSFSLSHTYFLRVCEKKILNLSMMEIQIQNEVNK